MRGRPFEIAIFAALVFVPSAAVGQSVAIDRATQSVAAATTADGPSLELQAAIDEALQNNPALAQLRAQFEAARLRPQAERFLMPPTFEAQIWQWPINTLNPANTNMYMLTVSQDIPGFGKRRLQQAVAEKDADLAQNEIAVRARDIVEQVKRAYVDLFLSRKAIEIHQTSVSVLRQLADASTIKYTAGRSTQGDVLRAVVEISKLHGDLVVHQERALRAAAQLNTLLNRPADAPIGTLSDPQERELVAAPEQLQGLALAHHPELRGAELMADRAQAALAVASRAAKPDFTVGGGYMLMPHDRDAWTATVGITWPNAPWSRGRADAQRAVAAADLEAIRAQQRALQAQVRLAVQDAYIRVKSAEQRAALLRTTVVPQSLQTLEVTRVGYQSDRVDFMALIDNQRALLDARLEYYRALTDLELAVADLERTTGEDLSAQMIRPVQIVKGEE